MTNLLTVLPELDTQPYSHILPSLERALISTADLLTLDAFDVAKRAQVPPGEVRKLAAALIDGLHAATPSSRTGVNATQTRSGGTSKAADSGHQRSISTLDTGLDAALNGGVTVGQLTEFVGER